MRESFVGQRSYAGFFSYLYALPGYTVYMYIFFLKSTSPSPQIILISQVISVISFILVHPSYPLSSLVVPVIVMSDILIVLVIPVFAVILIHPNHTGHPLSFQPSQFSLIPFTLSSQSSLLFLVISVIPSHHSHLSYPYSSLDISVILFIEK